MFPKYFIYFILFLHSSIAFASDTSFQDATKSYNFIKLKAGIIKPTPLERNTGLNVGNTTYTTGFTLGRKFYDLLSLDLEYMYRAENTAKNTAPNDYNNSYSWKAKSNTMMLNLSVDVMQDSKITPYIRGGIGLSKNNASNYLATINGKTRYYPGRNSNNFAWQIGSGINFRTTEKASFDIEYMFIDRGTIKTRTYYINVKGKEINSSAIKGNFYDHILTIGFKFKL